MDFGSTISVNRVSEKIVAWGCSKGEDRNDQASVVIDRGHFHPCSMLATMPVVAGPSGYGRFRGRRPLIIFSQIGKSRGRGARQFN